MRIIVEANIPYIRGLLEKFGDVAYLPASGITADAVQRADALFVRTRTRCDASLLDGSSVKFVATATIGTDHIDLQWCRGAGIDVANAPGCNAPAVAQYVHAVIGSRFGGDVRGLTLGVVGVGHVGGIVARWGERLGMRVLRCDPPRQRREGGDFVDLATVAREADVVTFHTPLTRSGADATWHIADSRFLESLSHCRLLVNSARGGIVDEQALLKAVDGGEMAVAIDCWENEPRINPVLLERAFVATPHIAGYSAEGKQRATAMALEAFERHYGVAVDGKPHPAAPLLGADVDSVDTIMRSYDPLADTRRLRANPDAFERLRNEYYLRAEVR